jgi:hypothetical protein
LAEDRSSSLLSGGDAAAVWRRAAELQEEETRRKELLTRRDALERAIAGEESGTGEFSLAEVEAAARDAGIPARYVHLAWLERRHDRWAAQNTRAGSERARRQLLGTDQQALEVSRRYRIPAERVLEAMSHVFPNSPFHLEIEAHEPLAGGGGSVLVFAVPGMGEASGVSAFGTTRFLMNMHWIDLKKLLVTVSPVSEAGEEPVTEVSIRSSLAYSRKLNYGVGLAFGSALGLAGGVAGVFAGLALFGGAIGSGVALAPVAVGATGLAGLGVGRGLSDRGYRALYRVALRKGRSGLEDLLQALALHAQTGGAFAPVAGRLPRNMKDPGS